MTWSAPLTRVNAPAAFSSKITILPSFCISLFLIVVLSLALRSNTQLCFLTEKNYRRENCGGHSYTARGERKTLPKDFNDQISSVKCNKGP